MEVATKLSGMAATLPFMGVNPAEDHVSWAFTVSSCFLSGSPAYALSILDRRTGFNRKGVPKWKNNLYSGSGLLNSEGTLTLVGPFRSHVGHHADTPPKGMILISA